MPHWGQARVLAGRYSVRTMCLSVHEGPTKCSRGGKGARVHALGRVQLAWPGPCYYLLLNKNMRGAGTWGWPGHSLQSLETVAKGGWCCLESVAKGRMVSGRRREKLPGLLGWAGPGSRGPWVGHASTPGAWGTTVASWPRATH